MKPTNRIKTEWTPELAYAIGLMASDGNLSKSGRHMAFISSDLDLIDTFKACLSINNKVQNHPGGYSKNSRCFIVCFGDVNFYKFLLSIGLTPAKSKTIGPLLIPEQYFFDFFAG